MTWLASWLIASLLMAGSPSGGQNGFLMALDDSGLPGLSETERTQPLAPWGPHFDVIPAIQVQGQDLDGNPIKLDRAFLLHRDELEKMRGIILERNRLADALEKRLYVKPENWWSRYSFEIGVGLGILAGGGATVGLMRLLR